MGAHFMIDTGSTRSFIKPEKAYQHYKYFIHRERFEVVSTHAVSTHDEVIWIPLFSVFKSTEPHKFYMYNVDSKYDGLIGIDLIKKLQAKINMENQLMETQNAVIDIIYNPPVNETIKIQPRSELRVRLPVNLIQGDAIFNYYEFKTDVRMPEAIVHCDKGYATTVIQNCTNEEVIITLNKQFEVEPYEVVESINVNNLNEYSDGLSNTKEKKERIDELQKNNLNKLRIEHMNDEERKEILKICTEYKDIFYCQDIPLSFTNDVKHRIRTKHEDPINVKSYRLPPVQAEEIERQVNKMLKDNIIRESHSPWCAPVHLVKKKQDASGSIKWRMVVDYRRLNEITVDDRFPLPNINDLFDKLGKSMYFTTLDLASGYHQIQVEKQDRSKTAFRSPSGLYEFNRMPFGLKTAPATFQRAINNVLRGLHGMHCLVYLDDVIIFSNNLTEHMYKLKKVFERFRVNNLKVQLDKSEFLRKEVIYLGHTLTSEGLKPNNDKIKAILEYPIPRTTSEVKSFLGLIGYYRKFIKDFANITKPISACLRRNKKIDMSGEFERAFETCKTILSNAPLLQYPDFNKPFILTTDASNFALGAVLSQGTLGAEKPVAYASRTLNECEIRYSTIEKELLAIVYAVRYFRPYLYGKKFTIITDHKPLQWLYSIEKPNSKLTRWRLELGEYDFEIVYKKGKQNTNADALSRIKINMIDDEKSLSSADESFKAAVIDISDAEEDSAESEIISLDSDDESPTQTIESTNDAIDVKPRQILIHRWYKNAICENDRSEDDMQITEVFLPLGNTKLIKNFLKKHIDIKNRYYIYFEEDQFREDFTKVIKKLYKEGIKKFIECTQRVVLLTDEEDQKNLIMNYHKGKTCHRGINETYNKLRRHYFWKNNMRDMIAAVISACEECKRMKYERNPIKPHIQLTQTQSIPFQEVFMDLLYIEGKYYLTLVDAFSKLGQAIHIPNRSTPEVVQALIKYFSMYGKPTKINSDSGTEFKNELITELLQLYKIEQHLGTPNSPSSMAIVERFHSTIIEVYRLAKNDHKNLETTSVMSYAIMAYNNSIHCATNCTPFEVAFGHTDLSSVFDIDKERYIKQQFIQDHRKRLKYLYEHIAEKLVNDKNKVRERKGGEIPPNIQPGDTLFVKDTRTRKAKHLPRYEKVVVTEEIQRNVVPVKLKNRDTKVAIKNIKRPSQVVDANPGPSNIGKRSKPNQASNQPRPSSSKARNSEDEEGPMGDN